MFLAASTTQEARQQPPTESLSRHATECRESPVVQTITARVFLAHDLHFMTFRIAIPADAVNTRLASLHDWRMRMIDRHWSVPDPLRERVLEQLVTDLRHEVELRSQQDRPTWRRLLSRILGDLPDRSKHRKRLVA